MRIIRTILQKILNDRKKTSSKEEKNYIDSFPEPKDDYDRTRFHYKCVYYPINKKLILILNITGYFLFVPLVLLLVANTFVLTCRDKRKNIHKYNAVLINSNNRIGKHFYYEDRIPKEIEREFGEIQTLMYQRYPVIRECRLSRDVLYVWIRYVLRHPFSGWTNIHSLVHLAMIDEIIYAYSPKLIINSRVEINYMSSLITLYCEKKGVEYSCFMHGELLANMEFAFVRFSRFYLWDRHYISLFKWARADKSQFIIYTPEILSKNEKTGNNIADYDYTYYMTGTAEGIVENYNAIYKALTILQEHGLRIKVRPHPRWSDMNIINALFRDSEIDIETSAITMKKSLERTKGAIGIMSTTLLEAQRCGKTIVLDDISNPNLYDELEKRLYILFDKPHSILSDLVKKCA